MEWSEVAGQVGSASSRQPEDAVRWGRSRNRAEWNFLGPSHIVIRYGMVWYCVTRQRQPTSSPELHSHHMHIYILFRKCKCNRLYHATMSMLIGYVHIGMHVFMDELEWMAYVRVAYTLSSTSQASIGLPSVVLRCRIIISVCAQLIDWLTLLPPAA